MKLLALTKRNLKEMMRDPLSYIFCIVFPLIMLVLLSIIFSNMQDVPVNFQIENYAPGICVFGFTFITLMVAMQIATDKNTSFMKRIIISPANKFTYYTSFLLSFLPVVFAQMILFFVVALIFGFPFNLNFLLSIIYLIPSAIFYIVLGIFIGSISKNEQHTGPITSIFITLVGILGGVYIPMSVFSGGFAIFLNVLPFIHTISIASELHTIGASCIYPHILYILGYTAIFIGLIFLIEKLKSIKK